MITEKDKQKRRYRKKHPVTEIISEEIEENAFKLYTFSKDDTKKQLSFKLYFNYPDIAKIEVYKKIYEFKDFSMIINEIKAIVIEIKARERKNKKARKINEFMV